MRFSINQGSEKPARLDPLNTKTPKIKSKKQTQSPSTDLANRVLNTKAEQQKTGQLRPIKGAIKKISDEKTQELANKTLPSPRASPHKQLPSLAAPCRLSNNQILGLELRFKEGQFVENYDQLMALDSPVKPELGSAATTRMGKELVIKCVSEAEALESKALGDFAKGFGKCVK